MSQIRIFIDMDDTLCDYTSAYNDARLSTPSITYPQCQIDFFRQLKPLNDAIECLNWMLNQDRIDPHILTAPSVKNPACYMEKRLWVGDHLGKAWLSRLHISLRKDLFIGHILIDDQISGRGQEHFGGLLVPIGSPGFENWAAVRLFLEKILQGDKNLSSEQEK